MVLVEPEKRVRHQTDKPRKQADRSTLQLDQKQILPEFKLFYSLTSNIEDVEKVWRSLEKFGLQSPGQSYEIVKTWIEARHIPTHQQVFVTAYVNKEPIAVLPLRRTKRFHATVLTWFLGSHVACNGVLLNHQMMQELSPEERADFWSGLLKALPPADALYLPGIPQSDDPALEMFKGYSNTPVSEIVYRAKFSSWDEIDAQRRDRKRRRRDKQHRRKLDAVGEVRLERIDDKTQAEPIIKEMFAQKRRRFELLGIEDPFANADVRQFYYDAFDAREGVTPLLYVLYVGDQIAGVRYCIQQRRRLFMLISSMSDDKDILPGSPGHQCLLETFKVAFDEHGIDEIDIGIGESDEKLRWCNAQVPVYNHFIPRSLVGWAFLLFQSSLQRLKSVVKRNRVLFNFYKSIRSMLPQFLRT